MSPIYFFFNEFFLFKKKETKHQEAILTRKAAALQAPPYLVFALLVKSALSPFTASRCSSFIGIFQKFSSVFFPCSRISSANFSLFEKSPAVVSPRAIMQAPVNVESSIKV